jgi:hypothetical protein
MTRRFWLLWLLLLSSPFAVMAAERLTVTVSPAHSFGPTNLTIRVHVEPDATNRMLDVVAESPDYLRSSRVQLDGKDAPSTVRLEFRSLPGGDYVIRASVIDSTGRTRATARTEANVLRTGAGQ